MYLYYLLLVSPFYHLAIKPGRGASKCRDKDPDPVASVDFWPAGSGSIILFIGSESNTKYKKYITKYNPESQFKLKMIIYKIEFYAYLPKIHIYYFLHFEFGSYFILQLSWIRILIHGKKCWIIIPAKIH